jgi:hypothetical protein
MRLPTNIKTFLSSLPAVKSMRGEDQFVAIAYFLANGESGREVATIAIQKAWSKGLLGKGYNSAYSTRAQGRINPCGTGKVCLTDEGTTYVEGLFGSIPSVGTSLVVFKKKNAHSFDKLLREILGKASTNVDIADTYVSGKLFDTLLDEIPQPVPIRFVYQNDTGGFVQRSTRFSQQYDFTARQSMEFHDRFLIVDGKGYIIGPSLKDAADKKPATLVTLGHDDSKKLVELFGDIWGPA